MIIKYNLFLAESITMSNEDVVDILKSLETEDNKNAALIKRLVNKEDNKGKNVLMTIVQSNNEELVDYILKFDVNINHTIKTGENVLFFCKSIKMFKKFYELGADINAMNIDIKKNVLYYLSSKKLFNVELYQKLIDDGIDINSQSSEGILSNSILNKGIVELLIKNNIDLNDEKSQYSNIYALFNELKYLSYKKVNKKILVFNMFKLLFDSGMNILDIDDFTTKIIELEDNDLILEFINKLKTYITDDMIVEIYKKYTNRYYNIEQFVLFAKKLLNIKLNIKLYNYLKSYYRGSTPNFNFYTLFADFIKDNPYIEDMLNHSSKYNL